MDELKLQKNKTTNYISKIVIKLVTVTLNNRPLTVSNHKKQGRYQSKARMRLPIRD